MSRRDWVPLVLAVGVAGAVILITATALYDAIVGHGPGLTDNATQVLTEAIGGIVGVLGAYIGFKAADRPTKRDDDERGP